MTRKASNTDTEALMDDPYIDEETPLLVQAPPSSDEPSALPMPNFAILLLLQFMEPFAGVSTLPFSPEAVRLTGITGGNEKRLGYYSGIVSSLFFCCEGICVLQWGRLSDRIGRKPVLVFGSLGLSASLFLFGISRSFHGLVLSRALAGLCNGNIGVSKSATAEILDKSNAARGFGLVSAAFSLSVVLGPLVGGALTHPSERFGGVFEAPFWRRYPFALSCTVVAATGLLCAVTTFAFFEETLGSQARDESGAVRSSEHDALSSGSPDAVGKDLAEFSVLRLVSMPPVRIAIASYAASAFLHIAYGALLSLWGNTSVENGGMGLNSAQVGYFIGVAGTIAGLGQLFLFERLQKRMGSKNLYRYGMLGFIGVFGLLPIANLARRHDANVLALLFLILVAPCLCFAELGYATSFLFINDAAPRQALGTVNGISQTFVSLIRAIGPILSTSLFAMSVSHDLLGGNLVYYLLCCLSLGVALIVGGWLPD